MAAMGQHLGTLHVLLHLTWTTTLRGTIIPILQMKMLKLREDNLPKLTETENGQVF